MGRREGFVTTASMSSAERWGWRLLLPLMLTPAALSWWPIAAVDGEYGRAGRIAVSVYALVVIAGLALLWHAARVRRRRTVGKEVGSAPRHARQ